MKIILALPMLAAVAGCSSLGPTPAQIKAMEGTSSSFCIKSPGWNGSAIEAHYSSFGGKSVGTAGGGGQAQCGASSVTYANEGKVQPAQPAKVTP